MALNEKHLSNSEFKHALCVWNTFNLKNVGEYHYLYIKTDVLILPDVFENFRK